MANTSISFRKVATRTSSLNPLVGQIVFVEDENTIYVAKSDPEFPKSPKLVPFYGGVVKDITTAENGNVLTISFMEFTGKNPITINFSDFASAEAVAEAFANLHIEGYTPTSSAGKNETRITDAADLVINTASKLRFDNWTPSGNRLLKGISVGVLGQDGTDVSDTNPARIIDVANDVQTGDVQIKGIETPTVFKGNAGYDGSFVATKEYVDGISCGYDSTKKQIKLVQSQNGGTLGTIDCSDFIKDGMLVGTKLVDATATTMTVTINGTNYTFNNLTVGKTYILFVWNADSGAKKDALDVTDLVDTYTAGTGITIQGDTISFTPKTAGALNYSSVANDEEKTLWLNVDTSTLELDANNALAVKKVPNSLRILAPDANNCVEFDGSITQQLLITPSIIGAATSAQGLKADSAIQSVKTNTSAVLSVMIDDSKNVTINAITSIPGAGGKGLVTADIVEAYVDDCISNSFTWAEFS